jgi:hypothetical protein
VLVIDTHAKHIGDTTVIDKDHIQAGLLAPLRRHGHLGTGFVLTGRQVTPQAVLSAIKHLSVRPGDTALVYYTGQGGLTRERHVLCRSHGDLPRVELRRAVAAKHPRLAVILTDCCANRSKRPRAYAASKEGMAPAGDRDVIAKLFFGARGLVDVNAARPGEFASCDTEAGGYFTAAFTRALARKPACSAKSIRP